MSSKNKRYRDDGIDDEYFHSVEKVKVKSYKGGKGGESSDRDQREMDERDENREYYEKSRNVYQDNFSRKYYDKYRDRGGGGYSDMYESKHGEKSERSYDDHQYGKYDEDRYDFKRGKKKYEERRYNNRMSSSERGHVNKNDGEHYEKYNNRGTDDEDRKNRKGWTNHYKYSKDGDRKNDYKLYSKHKESERRRSYNNSSIENSESEYSSRSEDSKNKYHSYRTKKYKIGEKTDEYGEFSRFNYTHGGHKHGSYTRGSNTHGGYAYGEQNHDMHTIRKITNINDVLEMKNNIELSRFIFIYKLSETITEEEIDEIIRNIAISNAFSLPDNIYINKLSFFSVKDELFVREGLEFIKNNTYFNNIQLNILTTQLNNQINDDRCCMVEFPSNEASAKLFSIYEKNNCCIEMGNNISYIFPIFKLKKKGNKLVEDSKQPLKKFYDWYCSYCNFLNFSRRTACFFCKETKTNDAKMVECENKATPNVFIKNVVMTSGIPHENVSYGGVNNLFNGGTANMDTAMFTTFHTDELSRSNIPCGSNVMNSKGEMHLHDTGKNEGEMVYPLNKFPTLQHLEENSKENFETSIKEISGDGEKTNMLILKDIDGNIPNKDILNFINEVFENRHVNYLYLFNDIRNSNKRKGFCFVEFHNNIYAEQMMNELEGNYYISYKNNYFKLDYVYEKGKEYFFHSIKLAKLNINKSLATTTDTKNCIPYFNFFVSYIETALNMMNILNYTYFLLWSSQIIILKNEKPSLTEFFFDSNTQYYYHPVYQIYFDHNTNFYMSLARGYYIWNDNTKCLVRMYMENEQVSSDNMVAEVGEVDKVGKVDEIAKPAKDQSYHEQNLALADQDQNEQFEGKKENRFLEKNSHQVTDNGYEITLESNIMNERMDVSKNSLAGNAGGNENSDIGNLIGSRENHGKDSDPILFHNHGEDTQKNTTFSKISTLVEKAKMIALASKKNLEQMNMNENSSSNVEKKSKEIIKKHFATDSADEDNDDPPSQEPLLDKKGNHNNVYNKSSQLNKTTSRIGNATTENTNRYHKAAYKSKNSLIQSLSKVHNRLGQWTSTTTTTTNTTTTTTCSKDYNNYTNGFNESNKMHNNSDVGKIERINEYSSKINNDFNICFICLRKFTNADLLQKHVDISLLHKRNLQLVMDIGTAG
ncbi:Ran-binding protein [Plasmodium gonderi]|uniref:Ran-binding protein n=1 Tax=Plasmodium gonderi TaxID=77519 RepID=A0A1Y1JGR0_PLAGO|nr:Ran-binding protein [Plasmodium gonderi]GAW81719.1 Ran-binding protein [Plasmodium gonderi]